MNEFSMKAFLAGLIITALVLGIAAGGFAVFYAGNQQIVSTVTTGTAPFSVTSTTKVANLNVQYINGYDSTELRGSCTPVLVEQGTSSTTAVSAYSCTGCRGWLQMVRAVNTRGDEDGTLNHVTIQMDDSPTITVTNDDPPTGTTDVRDSFILSRFVNNLTITHRTSSAANGAVANTVVTLCREE